MSPDPLQGANGLTPTPGSAPRVLAGLALVSWLALAPGSWWWSPSEEPGPLGAGPRWWLSWDGRGPTQLAARASWLPLLFLPKVGGESEMLGWWWCWSIMPLSL